MTTMTGSSTGGIVGQPAYRRFTSDMPDERGVIPAAMLQHPQLAALEVQRQRLVKALREAQHPNGKPHLSDSEYVAARAKALREGTELPASPPTRATVDANAQRRARDVAAAEAALMTLADDICHVVRAHPAFEYEGRQRISELRKEAEGYRRAAEEAERDAERAQFLVQWLERVAADELYVVTSI